MKIPIIKYSDKFLDRISILMKIGGITLYPFIVLRERYKLPRYKVKNDRIVRHESTHIKQQVELLVVGFYVLYILEFLIKLLLYRNTFKAYKNLSFEKEAKMNENDLSYLDKRKSYNWIKYII